MWTEITVTFSKFNGARHWHMTLSKLGEDGYGTWLGGRAGFTIRNGRGAERITTKDHVMLLTPGLWWSAVFIRGPLQPTVYCDMATPTRWVGATDASMIDLDLDVRRGPDGTIEILDEDEFVRHSHAWHYPAAVVANARAACDWVADQLQHNREPFAAASLCWFAELDRR